MAYSRIVLFLIWWFSPHIYIHIYSVFACVSGLFLFINKDFLSSTTGCHTGSWHSPVGVRQTLSDVPLLYLFIWRGLALEWFEVTPVCQVVSGGLILYQQVLYSNVILSFGPLSYALQHLKWSILQCQKIAFSSLKWQKASGAVICFRQYMTFIHYCGMSAVCGILCQCI